MTSSESTSPGSTGTAAERSATTSDDSDVEPVTAELPPSRSDASRRGRGKSGRPDVDAEPEGVEPVGRTPFFAPARRPGRRVIRVVRHVQLWSVFKVALLGGLVLYGIFLLAVAVGWSLANATGQVHHIEKFMRDIGFDNWSFNGPQLFRGATLGGAVLLGAGSVFITLWAAVVNLIAELTGGLRFTVIETDETDEDEDDL